MLAQDSSARAHRIPIVNICLITVNVVIFLYEVSIGSGVDEFVKQFGLNPSHVGALIVGRGDSNLTVLLTLLTAMFVHVNWLSLAGNMLFLWIFGDPVEERLGSEWYLALYVSGGIFANFAQVFIDPSADRVAVGASGAITAVLAAYILSYSEARVSVYIPILFVFTLVDIPALLMIASWLVVKILTGITSIQPLTSSVWGIAWWAHAAALGWGLLFITVVPKQIDVSQKDWSGSVTQRAQEDPGLVGLLIGMINVLSQVTQIAIATRVILLYIGLQSSPTIGPYAAAFVKYTQLFVLPFDLFVHADQFLGQPVDLAGLVAIGFLYVATAGLIWLVAALLYDSSHTGAQKSRSGSYV